MNRNTLPTGAFINPHTGQLVAPGKVLGYRRDGRPIYAIAGGDGTGDDGTGSGDADGTTGGDGPGGKEADSTGDAAKKPEIKGDFDPERHARSLAAARDSEKKAKDRASAAEKAKQDLVDSIAVALGLKPDPKADPAALAAQAAKELTDTKAQLAEQKTENAILRLASKAGADEAALRDSVTFKRQLAELDPTAADFDTQVTAAIKEAVKTNPKLAATAQGSQGPARQGADITGSGGGSTQRPTSLGAAISKAWASN